MAKLIGELIKKVIYAQNVIVEPVAKKEMRLIFFYYQLAVGECSKSEKLKKLNRED